MHNYYCFIGIYRPMCCGNNQKNKYCKGSFLTKVNNDFFEKKANILIEILCIKFENEFGGQLMFKLL